MNQWTLKFRDQSLEDDFFREMTPGLMKYFYWVSITLIILCAVFSIQLFILQDFTTAFITSTISGLFMVTYLFIRAFNNMINVGFLIYNVLLFCLQWLYLFNQSYISTNLQIYLFGVCDAYFQVAFITGTNFTFKLFIIVFVALQKVLLTAMSLGFFEGQIIVVCALFYFTILSYWNDKTRRDFFLSQYANQQFYEILDHEIKSNIIMCSIDQENVRICFLKANQAAKQNLKISDEFLLSGYLRSIKMNKMSLEEWLFKMYKQGLLKNTILQTQDAEIRIRVFDKLNHQILLFIDSHENLVQQLKTSKDTIGKMECQHRRYILFTAASIEKINRLVQKLRTKQLQSIQQQINAMLIHNTNIIYNQLYLQQSPKLVTIQKFNLLKFLRQFLIICNLLSRQSQSQIRLYYPSSCDIPISSNLKYLSHILMNQIRSAISSTRNSNVMMKVAFVNHGKHPTCEIELTVPLSKKKNCKPNLGRNQITGKLLKLIGPTDQVHYTSQSGQIKMAFSIYTDLKRVITSLKL